MVRMAEVEVADNWVVVTPGAMEVVETGGEVTLAVVQVAGAMEEEGMEAVA